VNPPSIYVFCKNFIEYIIISIFQYRISSYRPFAPIVCTYIPILLIFEHFTIRCLDYSHTIQRNWPGSNAVLGVICSFDIPFLDPREIKPVLYIFSKYIFFLLAVDLKQPVYAFHAF
jgi:hypothetical protein